MSDGLQDDTRTENQFAQDDDEAAARFEIYKQKDPFPDILPSLLNSADISDYVSATGMICPFYLRDLKSASYEAKLMGEYIYWDNEGDKQTEYLKEGDQFQLKPNSIAFVNIEPKFRLPDYIALRFNLKITNVHRGLLLGTGPLIDPGFEGKILIPLHNLTTNEYTFEGGEGLIWIEFTKLSENKRWNGNTNPPPRLGEYKPFPSDKKNRRASYYLSKAAPHKPIRSSIPGAIQNAELSAKAAVKSAEEAAGQVKSIQFRLNVGAFIGIVTLIIAILFGAAPILSLVQDAVSYVNGARVEFNTFRDELHKNEIKLQSDQIEKIQKLEKEVQELKNKIENIVELLR